MVDMYFNNDGESSEKNSVITEENIKNAEVQRSIDQFWRSFVDVSRDILWL